jgi:uncharacterized membrane protein YdjX (TVP38/TMEM64 family)
VRTRKALVSPSRRSNSVHKYKRILLVLLFLALLLALFQLSGLRAHFSLEFLRQHLLENKLSGLAIFVLLFAVGNLLQIPGWIFLAAAVLALGRTWGGLASYVAAIISCGFTFFTIRWLGGDALRELSNPFARKLFSQLDARPITSVTLLRVLFQTVPPLNYALALSGVKFHHYLIGSLLGLPLPIFLYCLFFDQLANLLLVN